MAVGGPAFGSGVGELVGCGVIGVQLGPGVNVDGRGGTVSVGGPAVNTGVRVGSSV